MLVGITALTFASIGGGTNRSKTELFKSNTASARNSRALSLRSGMNYRGSLVIKEDKSFNAVSYRSLTIYQKGNATYLLPNRYRLSLAADNHHSSLQMLNFRFKLGK